MGKSVVYLCCAAAIFCGAATGVVGAAEPPASIQVEYTFDQPSLSTVTLDTGVFDRVTMPRVPNCGHAGEPALPGQGARILLPYGCEAAGVTVVTGEAVLLGTGYTIEPVGHPVRLSDGPEAARVPTPDPAIYGSDEPFPPARFEQIGTQGFRGYRMLTLKLNPVKYVPRSGELYYYPRLTVIVDTLATGTSSSLLRGLPLDAAKVAGKVDNAGMVETYAEAGSRGGRAYDMLILTTPALAASFQPLKDYHDANGIPCEIHTTTDVGSTSPDDVRAYITDRYNNDGIEYVLIGGDDDIIPAKNLYVQAYTGEVETAMPGDIYFACLDGTWNYDGDSYWGEPNDGPGGGDVDLVAEVYVGRAAVGNTTEATRFVNKTIWYLTGQHSQPSKVQLVGEYLGFGGPADYAADTLEELIDGSTAHGYTTVGIPSDVYSIDELFERDMSWSQSDLVARINAGLHFLNHLGHGSPDYAMKLYNSDVTSLLSNDDLCFVYSQTCLAGHFDDTECWAETINIKTDHGAFAVIMNARYGFGTNNSTDGPSQRFNREFWDAVFNPAEGLPELGRANQDSKEDNLYRVNEECMRWCTYELNLFGDPTVNLAEVSGMRVSPSLGLDSSGPIGGPFAPISITYTVENMGPAGPISYHVGSTSSWVDVVNGTGTLPDIGATAEVIVEINDNANTLPAGRHTGVVTFTNTTDGVGSTVRNVNLAVGIPDTCVDAIPVCPGTPISDTTVGMSSDGSSSCGTSSSTADVWFSYTPISNGTLTASLCTGTSYDAVLSIHTGCPGSATNELGCDDDGCGSTGGPSTVTISVTAGETYLIRVTGYSGAAGNFTLTLTGPDCGAVPLRISFPNGLPSVLTPGQATDITVQIDDIDETYVPGSGLLYYRYDGGAYQSAALTPLGGGLYNATLPAASCGATPEFHFSAEGDLGSIVTSPVSAPAEVYTALVGEFSVFFEDDFETNQGWTVQNSAGLADGPWDRGVPVNCGRGDPTSDFDGSGSCYLTDNSAASECNSDVDDGYTWLISPRINLSGGDAEVSYALWYTNDYGSDPNNDLFVVWASDDDGANWAEVETFGPASYSDWAEHSFLVSDYVTPTAGFRVRFEASDLNSGSVVEAGIDAFSVMSFTCEDPNLHLIGSDPASGWIDACQPSDPDGSNPAGLTTLKLTFDGDPSSLTPGDFTVSEQCNAGECDGVPPVISAVTPLGGDSVELTFASRLEPKTWTTVTYLTNSVQLGYLPADASASGTANADDVIAAVDYLNDFLAGGSPPLQSCDIDRSGTPTANDIVQLVDLLNGSDAYEAYFGKTLP